MNLSNVSKTALFTLMAKAMGTKMKKFDDPKSVELVEAIMAQAAPEDKVWFRKLERRFTGLEKRNAYVVCKRAAKFDRFVQAFVQQHPGCTVVNLACGFDTRYWRIPHDSCHFIELDYPEVIAFKNSLFKTAIPYQQIGCSVVDHNWINQVASTNHQPVLFLAEGLLMYLQEAEVKALFQAFASTFEQSQLLFDCSWRMYTRGIWKRLVEWKWQRLIGSRVSFTYGVKDPYEIESYANGIRIKKIEREAVGYLLHVEIHSSS